MAKKKSKPAEDLQEDTPVTTEPVTAAPVQTPKKPKGKVYKSLYSGLYKLSFYDKNPKGEVVKKFAAFNNNTLITDDKFLIERLDERMKEEKDLPVKQKSILSETEFLKITSPEKLYIEYRGKSIHIEQVREGLEIAEKHGWEPKTEDKLNIGISKSRIVRGGASAGAVKTGM
jgi:hypothetical protein